MSGINIGGMKLTQEESILAAVFGGIAVALGVGAYIGKDKLGKAPAAPQKPQGITGTPYKAPSSPAAPSSPVDSIMPRNVLAIHAIDQNGQSIPGAIVIVSMAGFDGYADKDGLCLVPMKGPQMVEVEIHKPHNGRNGPGVQYPVKYKGGIHAVNIPVTEREE